MKRLLFAASLLFALSFAHADPQTTAFTYQGNLTANGAPANGNFNLTFKLFDAVTGGNQIGTAITMTSFPVVNGRFTTDLDFPSAFAGQQRWVEVSVGSQVLSPRQPVNSVPVAQFALSSANGGGTIIPYSSGTTSTVTTLLGGVQGTDTLLGFGSSASGVQATGGMIDLTGSSGTSINFAFSVPRDGTITSMSVFFSASNALNLIGSTVILSGQLYESTVPDNLFYAVPGANITAVPLTGLINVGRVANGAVSGLSIPVTAGTRLLFVGSATASGLSTVNTISGYWSAGVTIQ
jgi:BclB C-terminal domain-containing protein